MASGSDSTSDSSSDSDWTCNEGDSTDNDEETPADQSPGVPWPGLVAHLVSKMCKKQCCVSLPLKGVCWTLPVFFDFDGSFLKASLFALDPSGLSHNTVRVRSGQKMGRAQTLADHGAF
jgi:hypothetical protein